jgi:hypothetical protein
MLRFEDEVIGDINKSDTFSVTSSNGSPLPILKCLDKSLISFLKLLYWACIRCSYYHITFIDSNIANVVKLAIGNYLVTRA